MSTCMYIHDVKKMTVGKADRRELSETGEVYYAQQVLITTCTPDGKGDVHEIIMFLNEDPDSDESAT